MNRFLIFFVSFLFAVSMLACKRAQDPIGGAKSAVAGDPEYTVLASRHEASGSVVVSDAVPQDKEKESFSGAQLYAQVCSACHQAHGKGIPGAFPPLDDSPYVNGDKVERLAAIMLYGLVGPIKVNGVMYSSAMTPFALSHSDEELALIATYIRGAWSNKSEPVNADVFVKVRAKWGSRGPFSISELGEEK